MASSRSNSPARLCPEPGQRSQLTLPGTGRLSAGKRLARQAFTAPKGQRQPKHRRQSQKKPHDNDRDDVIKAKDVSDDSDVEAEDAQQEVSPEAEQEEGVDSPVDTSPINIDNEVDLEQETEDEKAEQSHPDSGASSAALVVADDHHNTSQTQGPADTDTDTDADADAELTNLPAADTSSIEDPEVSNAASALVGMNRRERNDVDDTNHQGAIGTSASDGPANTSVAGTYPHHQLPSSLPSGTGTYISNGATVGVGNQAQGSGGATQISHQDLQIVNAFNGILRAHNVSLASQNATLRREHQAVVDLRQQLLQNGPLSHDNCTRRVDYELVLAENIRVHDERAAVARQRDSLWACNRDLVGREHGWNDEILALQARIDGLRGQVGEGAAREEKYRVKIAELERGLGEAEEKVRVVSEEITVERELARVLEARLIAAERQQ